MRLSCAKAGKLKPFLYRFEVSCVRRECFGAFKTTLSENLRMRFAPEPGIRESQQW
jgi:hypothetical protein